MINGSGSTGCFAWTVVESLVVGLVPLACIGFEVYDLIRVLVAGQLGASEASEDAEEI